MSATQGYRAWWQQRLLASWQKRNGLTYLLLPLTALFAMLAALRRAWLRWRGSQVLPVPVLVVGNIYIGGTGKTPFVIWLVEVLRAAGFTPGVISRGYGAQSGAQPSAAALLVTASSSAAQVGDEPLLIAHRAACPVAVGRDRVAVAHSLLAACPQVDILISDDGLQHYALARQLECVLFDQRGCGNGLLLPAGPLREGRGRPRDLSIFNLPHELDTSQWQALLRSTGALAARSYVMRLQAGRFWQLCQPEQRCDMSDMLQKSSGQAVLAAAGIGHPERFFTTLAKAGLQFERLALPDHYDFADNPFASSTHTLILITEKDAVKCASHANLQRDPRIWVLPVEAQLDAALAQYIVEKCRGCTLT